MKHTPRFSLRKKMTVLIVAMSILLSATAMVVSYWTFRVSMQDFYERLGTNLARTLASQIEASDLDYYYDQITRDPTWELDEGYYATQNFIQDLVEDNGVEYLYVVRPHGKGVTFLFDSDMKPNEDGGYYAGGNCKLGTYMELIGDFAANIDHFLRGDEVKPIIQRDPSYGWLMTAMTPLLREDGSMAAYVMVDVSMNEIMTIQQHFLLGLGLLLAALTIGLVILLLVILSRSVIQPMDQLAKATGEFIQNNEEELASGTASVNVPEIHTGDEIEQLTEAFRKMEEDMLSYLHRFIKVTAEKERIGAELNVATQIQADMLPRIFPAFPGREEFDIYATMNPAKEVGGDFYDFFLIDDDHLAIVIADVSGKGVPAALFMVIAKTLIKNHAQNKETPGNVFTHTNAQLCEGNDAGLFVTGWMGILTISTGEFTFVNAGHNPPLLRHVNGEFDWLKSRPGFVLAGMEGVRYRENHMTLQEGDRLYLYTDGVTEATNASEELFGEDRLQAALNEQPELPIQTLLAKIKQDIDTFVGEAEQFDDITMLGLEYKAIKKQEEPND